MPAITDRSTKQPLLNTLRMNHGTLCCRDIVKTRKFYEEVFGLDVIQTSPMSLMIRKGTDHVYAVVELKAVSKEMDHINHNGFEVATKGEVDSAHEKILAIKEEWGLKKIQPPHTMHGDYTFFFMDFDGNWWEVVAVRSGGYVADFSDQSYDLTGRHDLADKIKATNKLHHVHDPEVRARLQDQQPASGE